MQFIRTAVWIVVTAILVVFMAMNWNRAPVNLWPLQNGNYVHFEWPVGVIALVFFLLGFLPMWLVNRAARWRQNRRISALENNIRITAATPPPPSPPMASHDPVPGGVSGPEPAASLPSPEPDRPHEP